MELKNRVRVTRLDMGISQSELARRCGVDPSAINHLESGRAKSLSGKLLMKMSEVLKVNPDWLGTGKKSAAIPAPLTPIKAEVLKLCDGMSDEELEAFLQFLRTRGKK